jgi:hypothetical protein
MIRPKNIVFSLASVCILIISACRLVPLATLKPMDADERTELAEALDISTIELVMNGPDAELNRAPLSYLLDKGMLALARGKPHWHFNLNLYFRILPILYFSLMVTACYALWLKFLLKAAVPFYHAFLAAAAFSILMLTNPDLTNYAIENRPYSLWIFLSVLHFFLLLKLLENKKFYPLYWLGSLLLMVNVVGGLVQVLAAALVRWKAEDKSRRANLFYEVFIWGGIAFWYRRIQGFGFWKSLSLSEFFHYWMTATWRAIWNPSLDFMTKKNLTEDAPNIAASVCLLLCVVFPLFLKEREEKTGVRMCLWTLLLALPMTAYSAFYLRSLDHRYFLFLYFYFLCLHFYSILALKKLLPSILMVWAIVQIAWHLPALTLDFRSSIANAKNIPIYKKERRPTCPESFGAFRSDSKASIDIEKLMELCL